MHFLYKNTELKTCSFLWQHNLCGTVTELLHSVGLLMYGLIGLQIYHNPSAENLYPSERISSGEEL